MSFWDGVWRSGDGRLALLPTGEIFLLDKRDGVSYNLNSVSGITRGENDIAFASHGGGHPAGDVYLYTVNDNAYWDTIFYCDLRIVKT